MPQKLVGRATERVKKLRKKARGVIGGSPGQTKIASDVIEEVRARMTERADVLRQRLDVLQERRPRIIGDVLKIEELPKLFKGGTSGTEVETHGTGGTETGSTKSSTPSKESPLSVETH